MPEPTWDNVSPLIADRQVSGRNVRFTFRCPASGAKVQASAHVAPDSSVTGRVASQAKRTFFNELRWSVARSVRSALGYNLVGRVAGDLAGGLVEAAVQDRGGSSSAPSESELRQAALDAFRSVSGRFVWDAARARWVSAEAAQQAMSPFEAQLARAPLTERYDRALLARMLVELSSADGRLSRDEEAMLLELIDADVGDAGALARRAPLSAAELAEASPGPARETLLMLAWSMALCDEELQDGERQRLEAYARALGVAGSAERQVRESAQTHVLEQVLDRACRMGPYDERAREQVHGAGSRLGMSADQCARAEARFLKRRGLF